MGPGLRLGRCDQPPRSRFADELEAVGEAVGPGHPERVPLVAGANGE